MNHPMQTVDQFNSGPTTQTAPVNATWKLPKPGGRPIVFSGVELAMAMSFTPEFPYWYEVNVYRTDGSEYVVAIRKFFQSENLEDFAKGWTFPTLDEALEHIINYDAANDLALKVEDASNMVPAEQLGLALEMQAKAKLARQHFGGLVGELLLEIESVE